MFLFGEREVDVVSDDVASSEIRMLTWNLQSPSLDRAKDQVDWLVESKANVLLLTEATASQSSYHLISKLESFNFKVFYSEPKEDRYVTVICTKGFEVRELDIDLEIFPSRVKLVVLNTFLGEICVLGVYAPTSWVNKSQEHMTKRRAFHDQIMYLLSSTIDFPNCVIGGDLNIVDPNNHTSPVLGFEDHDFYNGFLKFSFVDSFRQLHPDDKGYSWYSTDRVGFRFDYFFVSNNLFPFITECFYDHQVRFDKYSDHSSMWLKLGKERK